MDGRALSVQADARTAGARRVKRHWPVWWDWEIELTSHLLKRMVDRGFSEVDLREMLEHASDVSPSGSAGRWTITARRGQKDWEIIVEPDVAARLIVVVTAYPVITRSK